MRCSGCAATYPVTQGILNLLAGPEADQTDELQSRDDVAAEYSHASVQQIMASVSRHHFIPAMKSASRRFARRFGGDQWILDLGVGWAWHWMGVVSPNLIAMDLSFSSLVIARKILGQQVDWNVHLVCADGGQLPIKERTIDGIWSVQVLQHMTDPTLQRCLSLCASAQKPSGSSEIYWLNWSLIGRAMRTLSGKKVSKVLSDPYTLRYVSGGELRSLLARHFPGRVETGYSEIVFHPELRVAHRLPLGWLDRLMGRLPLINGMLARQAIAKVSPSK